MARTGGFAWLGLGPLGIVACADDDAARACGAQIERIRTLISEH